MYSKEGFKHHLVLKLTLSELEYEKITDLDKDIAKMYYEDNGLEIPQLKKKIVKTGMFVFFNNLVFQKNFENEESSYLQPSTKQNTMSKKPKIILNKENQSNRRILKKVTFSEHDSASQTDIKKLQEKIFNLTEENDKLKMQLNERNYAFTYRENTVLKAELQNMYVLQEENKDLQKDLEKYRIMEMEGQLGGLKDGKIIPESERVKVLKEENEILNIRVGELLEKVYKLEDRTSKVELKVAKKEKKEMGEIEQKILLSKMTDVPTERPQTAQVNAGFDPLLNKIEAELDLDIQKMLERNKKQLDELKYDMEEMKNMRPPRKKV